MLPYIVVALAVVALALLDGAVVRINAGRHAVLSPNDGGARSGPILLIVVFVLVIFSALRFEVGTDYSFYLSRYARVSSLYGLDQAQSSYQEPGYVLLSLATKLLSNSPYAIFWTMAILTVLPTYLAVKRASSSPAVSMILYVLFATYVTSFNTVRQGAAIAVLFLASTYLGRRSSVFFLLALTASSIHASALIAGVIYCAAYYWKPTVKSATLMLLLAAASALAFSQLAFLGPLLALVNPRYANYLGAEGAGVGTYLVLGIHLGLTAWMLARRLPKDNFWLALSLISVLFLIVGTQSVPLVRMSSYFSVALCVLVANNIERSRSATRDSILVGGIGAAYYLAYLTNYGGLIPYTTYLG